jgi:hypothetical protein
MDYKKNYDLLIEKCNNRNIEGYIEKHHIIPKSLGGSDEKENLVALTAREHFIAHLILAKIHGGPMIYAIWRMVCCNRDKIKVNSRIYQWSKEEYSKLVTGIKRTEQQIEVMKENGKKLRWVNNGTDIKRINKVELEEYLNNGWLRGRCDVKPTGRKCIVIEEQRNIMRIKSASKRNVHKIENEILISKRIDVDELDSYLGNGWIRGNGIVKTEEERYKSGNGSRGRVHSEEEKIKRANSLRKYNS